METEVAFNECVSGRVHASFVDPYSGDVVVGEVYVPTKEEYGEGRLARLFAKSHAGGGKRPVTEVYVDGFVREVYTDTWTLVPLVGEPRPWTGPLRPQKPKKVPVMHKGSSGHVSRKRTGECERCSEFTYITRHHVVHKSKGGGGGDNLQNLCWPCHVHVHQVLKLPSGTRVERLPRPRSERVFNEFALRDYGPRGFWYETGRYEADVAYEQWLAESD